MAPTVTFYGAAQTVTGSRHLLQIGERKILIDCGLFQGDRELKQRNWEPFEFEPSDLDAVIITHAHTDHIGLLPKLAREGYRGPIYATKGTLELAKISLLDGAKIQEEDARFRNKHRVTRHTPALPLYTEADAQTALALFKPQHFHQFQELPGKATFQFLPAGHILGSAMAEIYFQNGERILLSGDLGRYDRPILKDPHPASYAEYLVIESTYGDRTHSQASAKEELHRILAQAVENRGVVLVPSFAIGRTQELLWNLHLLKEEGRLPSLPIYIDSPMANSATLLYVRNGEDHDAEMKRSLAEGDSPLTGDWIRFVRDRNMSKSLNSARGPMMIISGSGMLSGGRILHHLAHHAQDPANTLLFTGYQAAGSLGRKILDGSSEVFVHKQRIEVRCNVERLDMLSAHADADEMLRWLKGFKEPTRNTFLVHGEPPAQEALAKRIQTELGWQTAIPYAGETFSLS